MRTFGKMAGGCFGVFMLTALGIGALIFFNRDAIGEFAESAKNLYAEVEQIQTDLPQKLSVDGAHLNYAWENGVTTLALQVYTSQERDAHQTQTLAKECAGYIYRETSFGKKANELTVTIRYSPESSNSVQTTSFTYSGPDLAGMFPEINMADAAKPAPPASAP